MKLSQIAILLALGGCAIAGCAVVEADNGTPTVTAIYPNDNGSTDTQSVPGESIYMILNVRNGLAVGTALGLTAASLLPGVAVGQWTATGGTSEAIAVVNSSDPQVQTLQLAADANVCLGIDANSGVVLVTCANTASQRWHVQKQADGNVILQVGPTSLCLEAAANTTSGSNLLVQACTGSTAQAWSLAPPHISNTYGVVFMTTRPTSPVTAYSADFIVPTKPPASGAVSVAAYNWPGQLGPLGFGTLGPVMGWGSPACVPGNAPTAYSAWWIAGQYYNSNNPNTNLVGSNPCVSGDGMPVNVGDTVHLDAQLVNGTWTQTLTDRQTGSSVNLIINMQGQPQNSIGFRLGNGKPVSDVIIRNVRFTMATPDRSACRTAQQGPGDYAATPVLNGSVCSIAQITLRAQGVAPTSTNP